MVGHQLDDEPNLYIGNGWLEITISIHLKLVVWGIGYRGSYCKVGLLGVISLQLAGFQPYYPTKKPWLFRFGDEILPSSYRDYNKPLL